MRNRRRNLVTTLGYNGLVYIDGTTGLTARLRSVGTSGAVSSISDTLNTNPATQGTAARQPSYNADSSFVYGGDDVLVWPIAASNHSANYLAVGLWIKTSGVTQRMLFSIRNTSGGANATVYNVHVSTSRQLRVDVNIDESNTRRAASAANVILDNVSTFVTFEWDRDGATEAQRCTLTVAGVPRALTFSNAAGTPNNMPTTLRTATGNILLGSNNSTGSSSPFSGTWGRNLYVFQAKQAGATEGLLTPLARQALMNLEPLAA